MCAEQHQPADAAPPATSPHRVRVPVNVHHWEQIAFLHWSFAPSVVEPLLAPGLRVATFDDVAWVGVTPFFIRVRPFGVPVVPPGFAFPETNLRTYVVGPDGRQGIQFLRMEVTAWWFTVALRAIGLPYVRRRMSVEVGEEQLSYRSGPVRPSDPGGHDIVVRPGETLAPPYGNRFERFLTARWGAFHSVGGRLLHTRVAHGAWHLRAATMVRGDVTALFTSAGLPAPVGRPVAHFSPGTTVKVSPPRLVRRDGTPRPQPHRNG